MKNQPWMQLPLEEVKTITKEITEEIWKLKRDMEAKKNRNKFLSLKDNIFNKL